MRYTWIVAALGIVGCAEGGGGIHMGGPLPYDAGSPARDGSVVGDAGAGTHDAGGTTGHDAGGTGHDAGGTGHDAGGTTGHDAGGTTTGTDAGSVGTDLGTPAIDAGGGGPTGMCGTPVDISAGGTWTIDTCAMVDEFASSCGVAGTPDVVVSGVAPRSGSTYSLHAGPGWVIQQLSTGCAPMPFSCGATGDWGVSGATFDPTWLFGVEKSDGTCGMLNLTVERVM